MKYDYFALIRFGFAAGGQTIDELICVIDNLGFYIHLRLFE